jgi:polyisoprenyl-phosphate glycosyltransferase
MLAAFAGLAAGAYFLSLSLFSQITVPGYASIIVAVLILGGLQLLALGIQGEYLGRLHLNVNRKPQYVVRAVCDKRPEERPERPLSINEKQTGSQ